MTPTTKTKAHKQSARSRLDCASFLFLVAFAVLPSVSIASVGDFSETIDRTNIVPAFASFVTFGQRPPISNHNSENQIISKFWTWVTAVYFTPRNFISDIFNILLGRHDRCLQQPVISDNCEGRILAIPFVSTRDADVFDDGGQFPSVGYTVNEISFFLNNLLRESSVGRTIGNHRSSRIESPDENIRTLSYGDGIGAFLCGIGGNARRIIAADQKVNLNGGYNNQCKSERG